MKAENGISAFIPRLVRLASERCEQPASFVGEED
jgi:hypothetical protein